MELQALLVLCGLGVAGIAIVLLMGLFSNSGTSYEEAIAQQRKATSELLALAESKNKSKKNNRKANKKQAKKEKRESVTIATGNEPESEAPAESGVEDVPIPEVTKGHVDFSPTVVVDVQSDAPPNVKIRKRGKDPKVKPILVNKEDPSCVSDPAAALAAAASSHVTNHFEEMHPKDEFELLQATLATEKSEENIEEVVEKKESKPTKTKGKSPAAKAVSSDAEPVKEEMSRDRHNSGDQTPKEQRKGKKAEKKPEKPVEEVIESPREEVVPPLNALQPTELTTDKLLKQTLANQPAPVAATSTPPGGKKKKKAEPNVWAHMAGDSGGVNVHELVRVVRDAALSRNEIQILTDALLNKHHDPLPEHSEWTEGPNDPMQKLKKQLADKEKALADEIEASQGFQAKLKELRGTLNAERARAAGGVRAADAAAAEARAELHAQLQRVLDDNHALAQDKLMLQSKLSIEGEAQAQRVQMEMHIQRLSEAEAALVQQLAALQAECQAHALDASAARDSMMMAQQHADAMAQQLQEANRACGEMEQQLQLAVIAEQRAQQDLRQLQERLTAMAELQSEVQRLSARAQAAESNAEKQKAETEKTKEEFEKIKAEAEKLRTGESKLRAEIEKLRAELEKTTADAEKTKAVSEKTKADAEKTKVDAEKTKADADKIKAEAEKQKQKLSTEIATLGEQLAARESELAEIKQMKAVPAQNGLPVNDAHKASEVALVSNVVEALRDELAAAQRGSNEQREQLARLQDQLAHYQHKNNELRTKNWKVMEALQSAEKALQTRSASALPVQDLREAITKAEEAQYLEAARVLRVACPAVAPPSPPSPASPAGRAWLQAFADNLNEELQKRDSEKQQLEKKTLELEKKVLEKIVATPPPPAPSPEELQSEKEYPQGWVDKYKRVINETEGVLSQLQQNVTAVEQRWAKQLSDKQQELDELRQRTVLQMQNKINELEAQLAQAKTTNHNHSFADAERLTEERLLAGLSEKLVDKCNGPSQVGLQEI